MPRDNDSRRAEGSDNSRKGNSRKEINTSRPVQQLSLETKAQSKKYVQCPSDSDDRDELDYIQQKTIVSSAEEPPTTPQSASIGGFVASIFGFGSNPSPSDRQKEQMSSEWAEARSQLNESLHRERTFQKDLRKARDEGERMQRRMDQMSEDLEATRASRQRRVDDAAIYKGERDELRTELATSRQELQVAKTAAARSQSQLALYHQELAALREELGVTHSKGKALEARVSSLLQESGEAKVVMTRLRNDKDAQDPSQGGFSLDSFRDAVDQVSEAHVSFSGHPSVERLNEAIDNLILETLEQATDIITSRGDSAVPYTVQERPEDSPLFAALAKRGLSEEHHGLLLDACLHDVIVPYLYGKFFQSTVSATSVDEMSILDEIFAQISQAEPWTVRQRWKAITATATSNMFGSSRLEHLARRLELGVSKEIAWAYGQPLDVLDSIRIKLLQDLTAIMRDAHELSIVLKRDILSVQMMVMLDESIDRPYDPRLEESVWPEMGARAGDSVIGVYGLGLRKVTPTGQIVDVIQQKVITGALLREIETAQ